jgi:hypothetical protein
MMNIGPYRPSTFSAYEGKYQHSKSSENTHDAPESGDHESILAIILLTCLEIVACVHLEGSRGRGLSEVVVKGQETLGKIRAVTIHVHTHFCSLWLPVLACFFFKERKLIDNVGISWRGNSKI